jgi:peptidoglycan/LPS O-acetylase OafA/YrhL
MKLSDALANRANNLDLLRLLAALAVIYGHAPGIIGTRSMGDISGLTAGNDYSGSLAVKFFFFASGLVVTNSYMRNPAPVAWGIARVFRIFPALILALVVTAFLIGPAVTALPAGEYLTHPKTLHYVTGNFLSVWKDCCTVYNLPGVFADHPIKGVNGALWTLPSEMKAYLFILAVFVVVRLRWPLLTSAVLVAIVAAGLYSPEQFSVLNSSGAQKRGLLACFVAGVLFSIWKDWIVLRWEVALGLVALAVATYGVRGYPFFYCAALFYGSLVLATWRPFMRLKPPADVSYGVYLYGWPVQQALFFAVPALSLSGHLLAAAVLSIGLGWASWVLVEKRAIGLGRALGTWCQPIRRRPSVPTPAE